MATAPQFKTKPSKQVEPAANVASERPPRRRRKLVWIVLALFVVLLWLLPTIVAQSSLRNWILAKALDINGTVTSESGSLGWLSSPLISDVEVRDSQGDLVMSVGAISVDRSLLALALNHSQIGHVSITHPVVRLVVDDDGSNIEEVFAPLLTSDGSSEVAAEVEINGGVLRIVDLTANRKYQIDNLEINLKADTGGMTPVELDASGTLPTDAQATTFTIGLHTRRGSDAGSGSLAAGKLSLDMEAFALDMLQPLLRRYLSGAELEGWLSAKVDYAWGDGDAGDESTLRGELTADDFALSATALKGDAVRLTRLEIPCSIERIGDEVRFKKLSLDCDFGKISVSGHARMHDFAIKDLAASLAREAYEVSGQVDLAKLARMLPNTFRIREGTDITGGELKWELASQPQDEGLAWKGHLETTNLTAKSQGRRLAWKEPLVADLEAHETADGVVIDRATCVSSFLRVDGSGALDDLSAKVKYDLKQLLAELEQFIDVGSFQLAGTGDGELSLKQTSDGHFAAQGDFQAHDFQLVADGRRPWSEPNLVARFEAAGVMEGRTLRRLDTAALRVDAGAERLTARLTKPLAALGSDPWSLKIDWKGQLAEWLPRLESFVNLAGWDIGGSGTLSGLVVYSDRGFEIEQATANLAALHVWGHGLFLDEPKVDVTASGRIDSAKSAYEIAKASLDAGQLAIRIEDASVTRPARGAAQAAGSIVYQADLAQIEHWLHDPREAGAWRAAGKLSGDAKLNYADGVTSGTLGAQIAKLRLADLHTTVDASGRPHTGQQGQWQEEQLSLTAKGSFDQQRGLMTIDTAEIVSDALRVALRGTVASTAKQDDLNLTGKIDYDWEKLAPLWRPYLGAESRIVGRESRNFAVRGPWPANSKSLAAAIGQLTGEAGIGWTEAEVYGFPIGKAEIVAKLAGGQLNIDPIDIPVSEGRLTLAPRVQLSPEPAQLQLAKGPLVTKVHLTPQICDRGLQYIAPLLAKATDTEGTFSINLSGGKIPLGDPAAGVVAGQLEIDSVAIRPGPIAAELVSVIRQIAATLRQSAVTDDDRSGALLDIHNQAIDFKLVNRRVYHQGFQVKLGVFAVTTHGSVGVDDDSLEVLAVVTIPDSILGDIPGLAFMKDDGLQLPIEGTLAKPKFDLKALASLPLQAVKGAAKDLLEDQLKKGLEKLLPGGQ